tara:strand:+ start:544 stop:936 length:393 start_codon:yes stop_codon:yes gene_type:complete
MRRHARHACIYLTGALGSAHALCTDDESCRLVGLGILSILLLPMLTTHHLLSLCSPRARAASSSFAWVGAILGAWAMFAIATAERPDLIYFPLFYLASMFLHIYHAMRHASEQPLILCDLEQLATQTPPA